MNYWANNRMNSDWQFRCAPLPSGYAERYPQIETQIKMRYITNAKINNSKIKRLMIYDSEDGVYLFEYDSLDDGSSLGDYWFEDLEMAFESCNEDYGVDRDDWEEVPDPLEHCQQDWIGPVRVVGREDGNPQWGRFEKLINGEWIEINNKG